jgi:hypothetical protein
MALDSVDLYTKSIQPSKYSLSSLSAWHLSDLHQLHCPSSVARGKCFSHRTCQGVRVPWTWWEFMFVYFDNWIFFIRIEHMRVFCIPTVTHLDAPSGEIFSGSSSISILWIFFSERQNQSRVDLSSLHALRVCDVCGSYQCSNCPSYNSATANKCSQLFVHMMNAIAIAFIFTSSSRIVSSYCWEEYSKILYKYVYNVNLILWCKFRWCKFWYYGADFDVAGFS